MARKPITTFDGQCQQCNGTGLWNNRAGYECFACKGTGKVTVAVVPQGTAEFTSYGFRVMSAKGNVTKQKYGARAELTAELPRYACGSTTGSGWWEEHTGTDPVGASCEVLGVLHDGELHVALPGGGYGSTGTRERAHSGVEVTTAVRVTEPAALAAIDEVKKLLEVAA